MSKPVLFTPKSIILILKLLELMIFYESHKDKYLPYCSLSFRMFTLKLLINALLYRFVKSFMS